MALQPGIFRQILACTDYSIGKSNSFHLYTGIHNITQIATYQQIGIHFHFYSICINDRTVGMVILDAFCWYNGAMYYSLFYSISLFLASPTHRIPSSPKSIIAKIIITLVSAALAVSPFLPAATLLPVWVCQPFSLWQSYGCGFRGRRLLSSCFLSLSFMPALNFQCICTRQYCPPIHSHQSTECDLNSIIAIAKGIDSSLMPLKSQKYSCLPFSYLFLQD